MKPKRPSPQPGNAKPAANRRSGQSLPPYNPGLQKLVEGKRAWTEPLSDEAKAQGFLGWHQRGYLPHCDLPGVTQFVTLRLDDSMPASRRSEWEALLHLEDNRERRIKLEEYLDRGMGECQLRQPAIAELAEGALSGRLRWRQLKRAGNSSSRERRTGCCDGKGDYGNENTGTR
ncbi:MAG: hypothetical protein IH623_05890 [Verrucomicrobia bacterium]|nr:hypothetical protein [Verrucomicrobiota bacterium]